MTKKKATNSLLKTVEPFDFFTKYGTRNCPRDGVFLTQFNNPSSSVGRATVWTNDTYSIDLLVQYETTPKICGFEFSDYTATYGYTSTGVTSLVFAIMTTLGFASYGSYPAAPVDFHGAGIGAFEAPTSWSEHICHAVYARAPTRTIKVVFPDPSKSGRPREEGGLPPEMVFACPPWVGLYPILNYIAGVLTGHHSLPIDNKPATFSYDVFTSALKASGLATLISSVNNRNISYQAGVQLDALYMSRCFFQNPISPNYSDMTDRRNVWSCNITIPVCWAIVTYDQVELFFSDTQLLKLNGHAIHVNYHSFVVIKSGGRDHYITAFKTKLGCQEAIDAGFCVVVDEPDKPPIVIEAKNYSDVTPLAAGLSKAMVPVVACRQVDLNKTMSGSLIVVDSRLPSLAIPTVTLVAGTTHVETYDELKLVLLGSLSTRVYLDVFPHKPLVEITASDPTHQYLQMMSGILEACSIMKQTTPSSTAYEIFQKQCDLARKANPKQPSKEVPRHFTFAGTQWALSLKDKGKDTLCKMFAFDFDKLSVASVDLNRQAAFNQPTRTLVTPPTKFDIVQFFGRYGTMTTFCLPDLSVAVNPAKELTDWALSYISSLCTVKKQMRSFMACVPQNDSFDLFYAVACIASQQYAVGSFFSPRIGEGTHGRHSAALNFFTDLFGDFEPDFDTLPFHRLPEAEFIAKPTSYPGSVFTAYDVQGKRYALYSQTELLVSVIQVLSVPPPDLTFTTVDGKSTAKLSEIFAVVEVESGDRTRWIMCMAPVLIDHDSVCAHLGAKGSTVCAPSGSNLATSDWVISTTGLSVMRPIVVEAGKWYKLYLAQAGVLNIDNTPKRFWPGTKVSDLLSATGLPAVYLGGTEVHPNTTLSPITYSTKAKVEIRLADLYQSLLKGRVAVGDVSEEDAQALKLQSFKGYLHLTHESAGPIVDVFIKMGVNFSPFEIFSNCNPQKTEDSPIQPPDDLEPRANRLSELYLDTISKLSNKAWSFSYPTPLGRATREPQGPIIMFAPHKVDFLSTVFSKTDKALIRKVVFSFGAAHADNAFERALIPYYAASAVVRFRVDGISHRSMDVNAIIKTRFASFHGASRALVAAVSAQVDSDVSRVNGNELAAGIMSTIDSRTNGLGDREIAAAAAAAYKVPWSEVGKVLDKLERKGRLQKIPREDIEGRHGNRNLRDSKFFYQPTSTESDDDDEFSSDESSDDDSDLDERKLSFVATLGCPTLADFVLLFGGKQHDKAIVDDELRLWCASVEPDPVIDGLSRRNLAAARIFKDMEPALAWVGLIRLMFCKIVTLSASTSRKGVHIKQVTDFDAPKFGLIRKQYHSDFVPTQTSLDALVSKYGSCRLLQLLQAAATSKAISFVYASNVLMVQTHKSVIDMAVAFGRVRVTKPRDNSLWVKIPAGVLASQLIDHQFRRTDDWVVDEVDVPESIPAKGTQIYNWYLARLAAGGYEQGELLPLTYVAPEQPDDFVIPTPSARFNDIATDLHCVAAIRYLVEKGSATITLEDGFYVCKNC